MILFWLLVIDYQAMIFNNVTNYDCYNDTTCLFGSYGDFLNEDDWKCDYVSWVKELQLYPMKHEFLRCIDKEKVWQCHKMLSSNLKIKCVDIFCWRGLMHNLVYQSNHCIKLNQSRSISIN